MGTRSLTFVYDEKNNPIINMYAQYDGYPSGHGQDIAKFLKGKKIVNGLSLGTDDSMVFNGMGCLAASLVAHFKTKSGGFYLKPVNTLDHGQDYEYHIYPDYILIKSDDDNIFSGSWNEFLEFCQKDQS